MRGEAGREVVGVEDIVSSMRERRLRRGCLHSGGGNRRYEFRLGVEISAVVETLVFCKD